MMVIFTEVIIRTVEAAEIGPKGKASTPGRPAFIWKNPEGKPLEGESG